ncbi:MAG: hypothetical protein MJZ34_16505, partial [Paludibacteraceae bacterium]|nr:hypothetical protein [Paludibacteraceae bacterium]
MNCYLCCLMMILYSCNVKSPKENPNIIGENDTSVSIINSIEIVGETVEVRKIDRYQGNSIEDDGRKAWGIKYHKGYYLYNKIISFGELEILDSIDIFLNCNNHNTVFINKTTDKKIHASFSADNKKLVINYLDDRPEYYDAALDDYFWIYNLDSLAKGKLVKDSIYCKYCDDGQIVDDRLFYTRSNERDDFRGGYWLTDIYVSPLDNIAD